MKLKEYKKPEENMNEYFNLYCKMLVKELYALANSDDTMNKKTKMISVRLSEDDIYTLNNILSFIKNDVTTYNENDIASVLSKIHEAAKKKGIELTDWSSY